MKPKEKPSFPVGRKRENLLETLQEAQNRFGYVPKDFMAETAQAFGLPISEIYGLATFYSFLSVRPLGRYVIRVCKSIPCYLKNAEMIIDSVVREIGIRPGQTSADGKFSFELTNCIGACDTAPAMLINHEVYGDLTPDKIRKILKTCK
ncbi:MAG TPA: NADH-quinone oxidoreductase subunit NuoE [Thermodesulfobacteriota bacterium]|nr:NADH-quinone oxidoreductase subunit NuoE [Thermodesulfobacteriota bacterium]